MPLTDEELQEFINLKNDPDIRLDEVIQMHYSVHLNIVVSLESIKKKLTGVDHMLAASAASAARSEGMRGERNTGNEGKDRDQA